VTYFELLGLSPAFDLDLAALETAYFREQRAWHPDRFVGKPIDKKQTAMQRSVDINQAYNTLKNPLSRAQYLLQLGGITVGTEKDSIKPAPALLMEVMEWREQVEEGADLDKLDGLLKTIQSKTIDNLSASYKNNALDTMAQEALKLSYVVKTLDAIRQKKLKKHAS
jgi:molecular chaperone HscB